MIYGQSFENEVQPYEKILGKDNSEKFFKKHEEIAKKNKEQREIELTRKKTTGRRQYNSKNFRGQLMVFCLVTGCITMILDARYHHKNKPIPKTVKQYTEKIYKYAKAVIGCYPEITDKGLIQIDDMGKEFLTNYLPKASLSNAISFPLAITEDLLDKKTPDKKRFVLTGDKRKNAEEIVKTLFSFNKYVDRDLSFTESYDKANQQAKNFQSFVFND
ncbi:MAG: hypothetical protein ACQESF_02630 [Nanobdellota archaeon]